MIQNFIWDGSTSIIAQNKLIHQIDKGGLKLCHFETKVKALKLSSVKRLTSENESVWKILPKFFYKCQNLNTYFKANHNLQIKEPIPIFYLEIHNIFMKFCKKEHVNLTDLLTQPLWLDRHILVNKDYIYYKKYENNGISLLKDILDNNCKFLDYKILNQKYNLKTYIMSILQIKSSVPSSLKIKLKQCTMMPANIPTSNIIFINNKNTFIEKTSCKDFYWHIINTNTYTPTSRKNWSDY